MFEDRDISVMAYNLETVLAEKFTAVLSLGVVNTRMKDFYDIHIKLPVLPLVKEYEKQGKSRENPVPVKKKLIVPDID